MLVENLTNIDNTIELLSSQNITVFKRFSLGQNIYKNIHCGFSGLDIFKLNFDMLEGQLYFKKQGVALRLPEWQILRKTVKNPKKIHPFRLDSGINSALPPI